LCIGQDEIELHDDGPHIKTDDPLDDKYLLLELLSNNEDEGYQRWLGKDIVNSLYVIIKFYFK